MSPWPGPCLLFLLPVIIVCAIQAPTLAAAACEPERCGKLTVSSPFGIVSGSEENPCAQLGFQVLCTQGVPYLGYYDSPYRLRILDIFVDNSSLLVSDVHKLGNFNLSGDGRRCLVPTASTATKIGYPFSISPLNQNLVFNNCMKPPAERTGLLPTVCRNNTFVRAGERYSATVGGYDLPGCNATAVPVLGESGVVNAREYLELISDGFLLTWKPPRRRSEKMGNHQNGRHLHRAVVTAQLVTDAEPTPLPSRICRLKIMYRSISGCTNAFSPTAYLTSQNMQV